MQLYHDNNGSVGQLIAETQSRLKADVLTLDYGINHLYFEFSEKQTIRENTYYHVAVSGAGGSFSYPTSFIGWKTGYPYPTYPEGFTGSITKLPQYPYTYALVGEKF